MSEEFKKKSLIGLKTIAAGLVELMGPLGAPAKALMKLAEELEKEESDAKLQEMAENIQQILVDLPKDLASRADIDEKQEKLHQFLRDITDASDESTIVAIEAMNQDLASQIKELKDLVIEQIPPEPEPGDAELEAAEQQYINYLVDSHGAVVLRGVRVDQPVEIDLRKLYVGLHILPGVQGNVENRTSTQELFHAYRKVVILGGPGSGKSTLLKRLILDFAAAAKPHFGINDVQLPIYLRLNELAKYFLVLPEEDLIYIGAEHILRPIEKQIQQVRLI
jgi:ABC-type multidrug transport system fused ATPase/permease subunit